MSHSHTLKPSQWLVDLFIALAYKYDRIAHLLLLPTKCLASISSRSSSKNTFRRGCSTFSFGDGGFGSSTIVFACFYCEISIQRDDGCAWWALSLSPDIQNGRRQGKNQNLSTVGRIVWWRSKWFRFKFGITWIRLNAICNWDNRGCSGMLSEFLWTQKFAFCLRIPGSQLFYSIWWRFISAFAVSIGWNGIQEQTTNSIRISVTDKNAIKYAMHIKL